LETQFINLSLLLGEITFLANQFICFYHFFWEEWRVIWVLTAGFGDGHNSAAKSVAEALLRKAPGEAVLAFDLLAAVHPLIMTAAQAGYRFTITHCPSLWRAAYGWFASPSMGSCGHWLPTLTAALDARLERERPRLIISTYPLYSSLLDHLRKQGRTVPPLVTVVTDSITVHPSWTAAPSDLVCVADEETHRAVAKLGVPETSIHITGFPVCLSFMDHVPSDHVGTRILYMPSTPPSHVGATLDALFPVLRNGARLTLQTGRHAPALYQTIRRFMDAHPDAPVDVIGWTNQLPRYLQTHDIVICKAGGAILHEALAARIPAIIDYVVPGQEEGNAELLLTHHCAVRSHSPQETAQHLQRLLDNHRALAISMRSNMRPLSAPDAALRVADLALKLAT